MAEADQKRRANQAEEARMELEKERKQEAAHRERVLEGLRQDKEDRERRLREAKGQTASSSAQSPSTTTKPSTSGRDNHAPVDYGKSRIMFRYEQPDGGSRSFIGEFHALDLFNFAIGFVKKETGLQSFTMRQMHPRRDFTESEDGKSSMKDLGLVPNGIILVIPAVSEMFTLSIVR